MPFISETTSAIKSRFGFLDRSVSASESVPTSSPPPPPDLARSAIVTRDSSFSYATSAVRSVGELDDVSEKGNAGSLPSQAQRFDFSFDPSFWNEHNVQVIIRVRPLSSSEISEQGQGKCVRQESFQSVTWTGHPESRFTFDLVADETVSQENLFKVAGVPVVENCMGGYNSCMFAYGQTGSGKTHTMLGDIEGGTRRHSVNAGMTPRVFEYLFSRIQKEKEARKDEKLKFTCRCSFLEIYNEQILDLLDPSSSNLQIREDVKKGIYVENIKEIEVTSARDVIQQLIEGAANRKVAATNMNHASSRSHSVFTCIIESKWESQGVTHHRFARLNLVDLAGSERQKSSGAEGERLKEATNINKSLSTLGLVIMNLVSISNGKSLHVPYRDSKLTFLLQDSLGGNAKTIMIANISPSLCCSLETLSTLKFAQRAKFIKNNAIVNEDASGDVIAMRVQIHQLKKEVSRLRSLVNGGPQNQDNETSITSFPGSPGSFRLEGLQGSMMSPLTSERRMSQKKDYEVALVGAFRREMDKDTALKALTAENQATMQLAKQREDEIQSLKMRLRFREAGIRRLEAVASGKISAETHLLKEKEEHLKEIEVLRAQVDRNQEVTRFAMENLKLKEEIRRLKSFYEEGEREMMKEQIAVLETKLLEALDWKLMHESDFFTVQNTISDVETDAHHDQNSSREISTPWQSSLKEENEFLRLQAIQNQSEIDALQKQLDYCLEEREKLTRHVNELETLTREEKSVQTRKEEAQETESPPPSSKDGAATIFDEQMELKTMVDAIAAASQKEAEAHEKAIILSKENNELDLKLEALMTNNIELESRLKALIEEKNSLIEMYKRAASECTCKRNKPENTDQGGSAELAKERVKLTELTTTVQNLEQQLLEMHEENEKLMVLYENAMHERDKFKRRLSSGCTNTVETREFDCPEKLVEVDAGECPQSIQPPACTDNFNARAEDPAVEKLEVIIEEMSRLSVHQGSCVNNELQKEKCPIDIQENECESIANFNEANILTKETGFDDVCQRSDFSEDVNLVVMKLEAIQEKISDSARNLTSFGSIKKAFVEVDKLLREVATMEDVLQVKQQELRSHELLSAKVKEKKSLIDNKLSALKNSLSNFASSVGYFGQRETRAKARLAASSYYLEQKKGDLARLQACNSEIKASLQKTLQSGAELRNNHAILKTKIDEENRRQENEKVLLSIDNIERTDASSQGNWNLGSSKAMELLKSEEEKTKLQNDLMLSREKLSNIKKELENWNRKSTRIENQIKAVEMDIDKGSKSMEELEIALQVATKEKESLLQLTDEGKSEIESMILEYQEHVFDVDLKEAETKLLEEDLLRELKKTEELRKVKLSAAEKLKKLLQDVSWNSCLYEKMSEDLQSIQVSILEAKGLLDKLTSSYR